jgi:uroporphyrin-III C-methyltransferase/precorrin-2 dehydrogenase/sirohydrochlorin ferrochelatase
VSFESGHGEDGAYAPDWRALAAERSTVVFYMGVKRLEHIVARLLEHGAPAERPAALVANGTTARQRVITGTLSTIAARAAASGIDSPALLIVGEVATLHATLAWFNTDAQRDVSESA